MTNCLHTRDSKKIWISHRYIPTLVDGWSVNGADDIFSSPGCGVLFLGVTCFETFAEAYDYCITQLKKRLDDTRREINSLEATHKTLLNPDFWQPHLERENA